MKISTLRLGQLLGEQPRRLEPVHAGHAHVHDHDVRLAAEREVDRARPVGRLADDADVGRPRERQPEPLADDLVVVDDQGRDLVRHLTARLYCARLVAAQCRSDGSDARAELSRARRGGASRTRRRSRMPSARASSRTASRTGSTSALRR